MNPEEMRRFRTEGLNILSIDGGGVRGLSAALCIERMMHMHNRKRKESGRMPQLPCEVFHLVGGTSSGGLLAIMLGRLRMDATACREKLDELVAKAFSSQNRFPVGVTGKLKPLYSSAVLRSQILSVLETCGYDNKTLLYDERENQCRVFVCATTDETTDIDVFRSYDVHEQHQTRKVTILEAAMATCAAVPFFEKVSIGSRVYCDGAFQANNPIFKVAEEGKKIWCFSWDAASQEDIRHYVRCIVSVGTGDSGKSPVGDTAKAVALTLTKLVTETRKESEKFKESWEAHFLADRAFRFNVEQGLQGYSIDDFLNIGRVEAATTAYLDEQSVRAMIRRCVVALSNSGTSPCTSSSKQAQFAIEGSKKEDKSCQDLLKDMVSDI